MQRIILLLLFTSFLANQSFGQTLSYKKVESTDITYVLNNIVKTSIYKGEKSNLAVIVYAVSDPSGSAKIGETHEVTTSIYFAVSEYDEVPEQYVYKLSSVYNPKLIRWIEGAAGPKIVLTYGPYKIKRTATIQVTLQKLIITTK